MIPPRPRLTRRELQDRIRTILSRDAAYQGVRLANNALGIVARPKLPGTANWDIPTRGGHDGDRTAAEEQAIVRAIDEAKTQFDVAWDREARRV